MAKDIDGAAPILVVDMDGTLFRNDTMHEALAALIAERPVESISLATRLTRRKAAWKAALADRMLADPAELRLRPEVMAEIDAARATGPKVALVSASDQRQVDKVANALGVFDEAFGSGQLAESGKNLSGRIKADFLSVRFGRGGFDYIGDSMTDAPVWAAARQAIVAGPDKAARAVAMSKPDGRTLQEERGPSGALLKAMRPHQWAKNTLIFIPLLASQQFDMLGGAVLAFVAFCLVASSVYLLYDLMDLKADRAHPRKRHRPIASADVSIKLAVIASAGLFAAGALIAIVASNAGFVATLMVYFGLTLAYSLSLKRRMIVDIWVLAGLYTIRIFAGGVASSVALSPWLLTFAMFLLLGLAAIKRQAELIDGANRSQSTLNGRAYMPTTCLLFEASRSPQGMPRSLCSHYTSTVWRQRKSTCNLSFYEVSARCCCSGFRIS